VFFGSHEGIGCIYVWSSDRSGRRRSREGLGKTRQEWAGRAGEPTPRQTHVDDDDSDARMASDRHEGAAEEKEEKREEKKERGIFPGREEERFLA
jgi:hypothetical protein